MALLKHIVTSIGSVCFALLGALLCILYSVFWLAVLVLVIPLLLVLAIPCCVVAIIASFAMMDKSLTVIDEGEL